MIRQTLFARDQAEALFDFHLENERPQAYRNLLTTIRIAASRIEAEPTGGSSYPAPYRGISRWGFRWIKIHRYWFAWSTARGYPLITNVFFDTSDIVARIAPDEGDELPI